ncbi:hypothetical protein [Thalassobacillus devorans]|uniref:hypothetical protein n=1 Tax=Thalassobacillus devorans TaxID=279813 RepID=UPI000491455F|nr:hypothetical protein [Thalassobacillus devorans]
MIFVAVILTLIGTLGFTGYVKKSKIVATFYTISLVSIAISLFGTFVINGETGSLVMIIGGIISIGALIGIILTKPENVEA